MKRLGIVMGLAALVISSAAAQDELERMKRNFEALKQEEVERPYSKGLAVLRFKYIEAIDRELEKAFDSGDLDAATALQAEKKAFGFEGEPDPNPKHPTMVRLRKAYSSSSANLTVQRKANLESLVKKISAVIVAEEKSLTRASRIDDALAMRAYRTELEALPAKEAAGPSAAVDEAAAEFPFTIALTSERREFQGPPREPVPDTVFYVESDESFGKLHLTFESDELKKLDANKHIVWLRLHTDSHRLSASGSPITVTLDGTEVGSHRGAPAHYEMKIPLKVSELQGRDSVELKIDCGKDAVLVQCQGSENPPHLIIDRAGGVLIEGEAMDVVSSSSGSLEIQQPTRNFKGSWSGDAQQWWKDGSVGSTLTLKFDTALGGAHDLRFALAAAKDYGRFKVSLGSGTVLFEDLNLYSLSIIQPGEISAGRQQLQAGANELIFEILDPPTEADPKMNGLGLDYIRMIPADK